MAQPRIERIEFARLEGLRPRKAGGNARLGEHGSCVAPPMIRPTSSDGATGFGLSYLSQEHARQLVGTPLAEAFPASGLVPERYRTLEFALCDLAGRLVGKPVCTLLREGAGAPVFGPPSPVSVYDTSLYIDDLHLADDDAAAALMAEEAREGLARGHRHFKLKVGRGGMHLPLEEGTRRDIRVILAVREAIGPEGRLCLDANNGYNLNLTKRVLDETAEARIYWMEEPFHEDPTLYEHLKAWLSERGLATLIADGEGDASPHLLQWARRGLIDVVQYDYASPGFTYWLELGPQLDAWGVRSAPHHYGGLYGNLASCHLAAAIQRFEMVEWDAADTPALDASGYRVGNGFAHVPDLPGFGLGLDEAHFARAVRESGWMAA